MNEKLNKKYLSQMETLNDAGDHEEADIILCDILSELGYTELIDTYKKLPKWYS